MRALRLVALLLAGAGVVALAGGCAKKAAAPGPSRSATVPTATATATSVPAVTPTAGASSPASVSPTVLPSSTVRATSPSPARTAAGPYTTIQTAEAYVQTQSDVAGSSFQFLGPDLTWRPSATLHVLRATPSTAASYGGDYYFFFVDGNAVSRQYFTGAMSEQGLDATTFAVTYRVFRPGDAHCCPTGGTSTVRFRWNGSAVVALDPMPGATQS